MTDFWEHAGYVGFARQVSSTNVWFRSRCHYQGQLLLINQTRLRIGNTYTLHTIFHDLCLYLDTDPLLPYALTQAMGFALNHRLSG
jgi:hypothetical protein